MKHLENTGNKLVVIIPVHIDTNDVGKRMSKDLEAKFRLLGSMHRSRATVIAFYAMPPVPHAGPAKQGALRP